MDSVRGKKKKTRAKSLPNRPDTRRNPDQSPVENPQLNSVQKMDKNQTQTQTPRNKIESNNSTQKIVKPPKNIQKNTEKTMRTVEYSSPAPVQKAAQKKDEIKLIKPITKLSKQTTRAQDHEYLQFLLRITEDIISNDLYSNRDMQKVFISHLDANKERLDLDRMLLQIHELMEELNVPMSSNNEDNEEVWPEIEAAMKALICSERVKSSPRMLPKTRQIFLPKQNSKNCVCSESRTLKLDSKPSFQETTETYTTIDEYTFPKPQNDRFATSLDRLTERTEPISSRVTCKTSTTTSSTFGIVDVLPGFECLETPKSSMRCIRKKRKRRKRRRIGNKRRKLIGSIRKRKRRKVATPKPIILAPQEDLKIAQDIQDYILLNGPIYVLKDYYMENDGTKITETREAATQKAEEVADATTSSGNLRFSLPKSRSSSSSKSSEESNRLPCKNPCINQTKCSNFNKLLQTNEYDLTPQKEAAATKRKSKEKPALIGDDYVVLQNFLTTREVQTDSSDIFLFPQKTEVEQCAEKFLSDEQSKLRNQLAVLISTQEVGTNTEPKTQPPTPLPPKPTVTKEFSMPEAKSEGKISKVSDILRQTAEILSKDEPTISEELASILPTVPIKKIFSTHSSVNTESVKTAPTSDMIKTETKDEDTGLEKIAETVFKLEEILPQIEETEPKIYETAAETEEPESKVEENDEEDEDEESESESKDEESESKDEDEDSAIYETKKRVPKSLLSRSKSSLEIKVKKFSSTFSAKTNESVNVLEVHKDAFKLGDLHKEALQIAQLSERERPSSRAKQEFEQAEAILDAETEQIAETVQIAQTLRENPPPATSKKRSDQGLNPDSERPAPSSDEQNLGTSNETKEPSILKLIRKKSTEQEVDYRGFAKGALKILRERQSTVNNLPPRRSSTETNDTSQTTETDGENDNVAKPTEEDSMKSENPSVYEETPANQSSPNNPDPKLNSVSPPSSPGPKQIHVAPLFNGAPKKRSVTPPKNPGFKRNSVNNPGPESNSDTENNPQKESSINPEDERHDSDKHFGIKIDSVSHVIKEIERADSDYDSETDLNEEQTPSDEIPTREHLNQRRVSIMHEPIIQMEPKKHRSIVEDVERGGKKNEAIMRTIETVKDKWNVKEHPISKTLEGFESSISYPRRKPQQVERAEEPDTKVIKPPEEPKAKPVASSTSSLFNKEDEEPATSDQSSYEDLPTKTSSSKMYDPTISQTAIGTRDSSGAQIEDNPEIEMSTKQREQISAITEKFDQLRHHHDRDDKEISTTLSKLVDAQHLQRKLEEQEDIANEAEAYHSSDTLTQDKSSFKWCGLKKKRRKSQSIYEPTKKDVFVQEDYERKSVLFEEILTSLEQKPNEDAKSRDSNV